MKRKKKMKTQKTESLGADTLQIACWFACLIACSPDYQSPTFANSGARLREED